MRKSEEYRENVRNCSELAAEAKDLPSKNRYKRMIAQDVARQPSQCKTKPANSNDRPADGDHP